MRVIAGILLASTWLAFGQPPAATKVEVFPQQRMVGQLNEIVASICNTGSAPLKAQAMNVWGAVRAFGFDPATYVKVEEESNSLRGMSARRKVLLTLAFLGAGFTIGDQGEAFKIGNEENPQTWKAAIPIVSAAIPATMLFVQQQIPESGLPQKEKMLPAAGISLDPGACGDWVLYGNWRTNAPQEKN